MENRTKILIALPPVLIIILIAVAHYIPFEKGLSNMEIRILEFAPIDLSIKEKQKIYMGRDLRGLWGFKEEVNNDDIILQDAPITSGIDYSNRALSLIVISGEKRMAIIGGVLVKEGDMINGIKIAKIETNRVLLKNKSLKWIYLEKEK
jgi:hypothetical protein